MFIKGTNKSLLRVDSSFSFMLYYLSIHKSLSPTNAVKICAMNVQNVQLKYEKPLAHCRPSPSPHSRLRTNAKGLFTWKEGASANRATRLEGLKHSPPLHATHRTGTVSGLRELSLERPLSTTNITADQGNFFPSYFSFLHEHGPVLCIRLVYYIDLFRLTVILFGI